MAQPSAKSPQVAKWPIYLEINVELSSFKIAPSFEEKFKDPTIDDNEANNFAFGEH